MISFTHRSHFTLEHAIKYGGKLWSFQRESFQKMFFVFFSPLNLLLGYYPTVTYSITSYTLCGLSRKAIPDQTPPWSQGHRLSEQSSACKSGYQLCAWCTAFTSALLSEPKQRRQGDQGDNCSPYTLNNIFSLPRHSQWGTDNSPDSFQFHCSTQKPPARAWIRNTLV